MLPKEEWLQKAQRLAVGRTERLYHRRERRPNLVVGHDQDKYWAYCQACKEGGVQEKTHVRLTEKSPERERSNLTLPTDLVAVGDDPMYTALMLRFLQSKGVTYDMLPQPVQYSPSRKRILLNYHGRWLGRDVTGDAKEKWLTYNHAEFLMSSPREFIGVSTVVEDAFSFFKVMYAVIPLRQVDVYCALGTRIKDSLTLAMLDAKQVVWMFDGDPAGYSGAAAGALRMRSLGVPSVAACAPPGKDPKDLTCDEIRSFIQEFR
jgi:hypothetical protein